MKLVFSGLKVCLLAIVVVACDVFDYSPHQILIDPEDTDLISKGISRLKETTLDDDTIKFVLTGDTQGALDDDEDFVDFVNTNYPSLDFTLICGDLTNYGLTDEFIWLHRIMKKLDKPYIPVIGNHDFIANGPAIFKKMYGEFNYSFKVGKFKFVAVNTNSMEFGFNGSVPDIPWLTQQLSDTVGIKNIFVFSHVMPWDDAFDTALEQPFANALANSKVKVSFHGHHHNYEYNKNVYGDGIDYVITGSTGRRAFLLVTLWDDGESYRFERVYF